MIPAARLRAADTARWAAAGFLLVVVLQRFALPGGRVALLVVAIPIWCLVGVARGLVEVDRQRLMFWLAAAGATSLAIPIQLAFVPAATFSFTAWGLLVAVWLPFTVRLVDRRVSTYRLMLGHVVTIASALAGLCVLMTGLQLAGQTYKDWFADVVPAAIQLQDFVITYPITYGSALYKANAWIGLEPSMVSAQLGLGLLAALFIRARPPIVVLLIAGLVSTVSGSGIAIVAVGVVVMLFHRSRSLIVRYAALAGAALVVAVLTPFGSLLIDRTTEFGSSGSSASLRALEPYQFLADDWRATLSGLVLGHGPGSSQRLVTDSNIVGLLVPSPAKVFFEYGLLAGFVLAIFMIGCYWGGPSRAFGLSLFCSLWFLQPGTTTMVIVAPLLVFVTLWSPRVGDPLESVDAPIPRRIANRRHRPLYGSPQVETDDLAVGSIPW